MEELLQVGVITSAHGIRGEVKVYPTTDDEKRFKQLKAIYLDTGKEKRKVQIISVKFLKNMVILKLEGLDDRTEAEKLRQAKLLVTRSEAVKLQKNEYFIADLIGMDVSSDEGEVLGKLEDVMQTGANDVYVVCEPDGTELLIPAIKECILDVNAQERQMKVHLLPGLREKNKGGQVE